MDDIYVLGTLIFLFIWHRYLPLGFVNSPCDAMLTLCSVIDIERYKLVVEYCTQYLGVMSQIWSISCESYALFREPAWLRKMFISPAKLASIYIGLWVMIWSANCHNFLPNKRGKAIQIPQKTNKQTNKTKKKKKKKPSKHQLFMGINFSPTHFSHFLR